MRISPAMLLLTAFLAGAAGAEETPRTISVSGEAEVSAAPDLARITAGVQSQAPTAGEAMEMTSTAMSAVFAALEAKGVARADFQTSRLSLDPVWDDRPQERVGPRDVVGYVAGNMVTIRLRDVDAIGPVIDALVDAGANRFHDIGFDVEEPGPLLEQARREAVADARGKAEVLAEAAGVTLGPVLSVSESGGYGGPQPMFARSGMADAAPVAGGTMSLGAQVQMVYGIE